MARIGSVNGTLDDLISRHQAFYRESYLFLFDMVVKHRWLEMAVTFDGVRRKSRAMGIFQDRVYSFFLKHIVGMHQRPLTYGALYRAVTSYIPELFPEFLEHDPFIEPERYPYPFKHVTVDFLIFVHNVHNRMELLHHAEEKKMSYCDFSNWAINQVLSYNDEVGKDIYAPTVFTRGWVYICREVGDRGLRTNGMPLKNKRKKSKKKTSKQLAKTNGTKT